MAYEPTTWARGTKITATKLNNIEQGVQSVNSEYTPTTWAEGDIVTATKLNNIEQGIANASGGGGSSDFSTAQVTITNKTSTPVVELEMPFLEDDIIKGMVVTLIPNIPSTFTAVLYKGTGMAVVTEYTFRDLSGNCAFDNDGNLIISGDCSFSIGQMTS